MRLGDTGRTYMAQSRVGQFATASRSPYCPYEARDWAIHWAIALGNGWAIGIGQSRLGNGVQGLGNRIAQSQWGTQAADWAMELGND